MNNIVKLLELNIKGIKNVENGTIGFLADQLVRKNDFVSKASGVIGIYGQNGSGKTAAIDSLTLLKFLAHTLSLSSNTPFSCLINRKLNEASVSYSFRLDLEGGIFLADYRVFLKRSGPALCCRIIREEFEVKEIHLNPLKKEGFPRLSIDFDNQSYETFISKDSVLSPDSLFGKKSEKQNLNALINAISDIKLCSSRAVSYLFSDSLKKVLSLSEDRSVKTLISVIDALKDQIVYKMFVFSDMDNALTDIGLGTFAMDKELSVFENGTLALNIPLNGPFNVSDSNMPKFRKLIKQINIVIPAFVPDFRADLRIIGDSMNEQTHEKGKTVELLSVRDGVEIPASAESSGIKKLFSICVGIIHMYNDPSFFLAVDELDSGVFELLLGQILEILGESAKGQLLFTCHNCRPMEVLDKSNIYVSTANPKERYVKLINGKTTNNIRDFYLRALQIGGQKERLYNQTEFGEIASALKKGGDLINDIDK